MWHNGVMWGRENKHRHVWNFKAKRDDDCVFAGGWFARSCSSSWSIKHEKNACTTEIFLLSFQLIPLLVQRLSFSSSFSSPLFTSLKQKGEERKGIEIGKWNLFLSQLFFRLFAFTWAQISSALSLTVATHKQCLQREEKEVSHKRVAFVISFLLCDSWLCVFV